MLLALIDSGQIEEAVREAEDAVSAVKRLGQQRSHPALLALWFLLLAEHQPPERARTAMTADITVLQSTGALWMAGLAMAWLAAREGRSGDAACLLG